MLNFWTYCIVFFGIVALFTGTFVYLANNDYVVELFTNATMGCEWWLFEFIKRLVLLIFIAIYIVTFIVVGIFTLLVYFMDDAIVKENREKLKLKLTTGKALNFE